ncbi:phosphatase PAP2 family protein [Sphingobium sp. SCG-1]|uniref:phosphatase PAP2 family protein n=1 Tax=Sphingobium sp. SCG-1 TaxID=2072936 RepID=UPI00166F8F4F|nr:phosphatase PAP2 family protein [Sphingobium sp. SCG-1]
MLYTGIVLSVCDVDLASLATLLATYGRSMISVWLATGLIALLGTMVWRHSNALPGSSWSIGHQFLHTRWRDDRLMSVCLPFLCFVPLITAYNVFKMLHLPSVGFWAGPHIGELERAMLGGYDGWQLTYAVLPSPWATQIIDLLYHGWFAPMVAGVAICSFAHQHSRLAWRYLTSFVLLWSVQGTLVAYMLPAAGPALRSIILPTASRFDALTSLMDHQDHFLKAHGAPGLYAVHYQHALAALFGQQNIVIGGGISAMPSMHNAMAVLFACAAWKLGRRAGIATTIYALIIWIGSVHLGWHYALDGGVACIMTLATWMIVGRIPSFFERRATMARAKSIQAGPVALNPA